DFAPYFQPEIDPHPVPVCNVDDGESAFYVRLETEDSPGVIGNIGRALGDHRVSLHSLVQRGTTPDGGATIVFLTHRTSEGNARKAIAEIEAQPTIKQINVALRVFG